MKSNYEQAWSDYIQLCSEGGSKSYLELLETAHLSNPFAGSASEDICRPIVDELTFYNFLKLDKENFPEKTIDNR